MAEIKSMKRNKNVDVLRGIAMLCVVLQHTMVGSTDDSQNSFLFQIVWSLQMPLFFLISGYVSRYSKKILSFDDLLSKIYQRTIAYLLPWVIWSFLVRGFILQDTGFLNLKWLFWHMDSGYWFLFTIWTINIIFFLSQFLANRLKNANMIISIALEIGFYILGMGILAGIGYVLGMSFLAIKLTLYYMPFYFAGYLYGRFQKKIFSCRYGKTIIELAVAVSLAIWLSIIIRFNMYYAKDTGFDIIIRGIASLSGCIAICGLIGNINFTEQLDGASAIRKKGDLNIFIFVGRYSLHIYMLHGFFINLLKFDRRPQFDSFEGVFLTAINYGIALLCVSVVSKLLNRNLFLRKILFGR